MEAPNPQISEDNQQQTQAKLEKCVMTSEDCDVDLKIIDSHVHLIDYDFDKELPGVLSEACQNGVTHLIENATHEENFAKVEKIYLSYPSVVTPSFGMHPWYLQNATDNWEDLIRFYLKKYPNAFVGECGLDWIADKQTSRKDQKDFFTRQLTLARDFQRPVSVHCVRAHGDMLKIMKKNYKSPEKDTGYIQKIIMHSWGGSKEIAQSLLKLEGAEIYLSFQTNSTEKNFEIMKNMRDDRIIVETDSPHQYNPIYNPGDFDASPQRRKELLNRPVYLKNFLKKVLDTFGGDRKILGKIWENSLRIIKSV
jgi:TatD DNase family protein